MWEIITRSGEVMVEDMPSLTWPHISDSISQLTVAGVPVDTSERYFYTAKYVGAVGCQAKLIGVVFGGINNGIVTEYQYDTRCSKDGSMVYREYPFEEFPYTHDIIKQGV